ncbi:MAG TPA: hypothetical protein VNO79_00710 [Actinomycetota bacterium]|nr:hypothetical protein [Actinomycetota bacterium]
MPGVPDDVRHLALTTWDRFLDTFPRRWACLADLNLATAWQLPDRGIYEPERRLVTVRIPATAGHLSATLVHEFGHHLDATCHEMAELRGAVLRAEGLPPDRPWRRGRWECAPAELFAEAVVWAVLGAREHRPSLPISPSLPLLIRAWGAGKPVAPPTAQGSFSQGLAARTREGDR